nr:hypothetical protein [Niallia taxi]
MYIRNDKLIFIKVGGQFYDNTEAIEDQSIPFDLLLIILQKVFKKEKRKKNRLLNSKKN